jgi:hypothetical protein
MPEKLPALMIDFSRDVDWNISYPLTDAAMAYALGGVEGGWSADKVRYVLSQHPVMSSIPIRCRGMGEGDDRCPYTDYCPFEFPELVEKEFTGRNCPVEVVEAFKVFAGFVIDLDIGAADYSDLALVVDLVRLQLLMRRCDLYAKNKPVWEKKVAGIVQATGETRYDKTPVLTFPMMRDIRKDIKEIYDQLIASRAAKSKRDAAMKDAKSPLDAFQQIKKAAEAYQKMSKGKGGAKALPEPEQLEDVQDAEYKSECDINVE